MADNRNIFVTMTLRDEVTGKMKKIEGSLNRVRRQLGGVSGETKKTSAGFVTLTGNVLKAAPAFAVATAAISGVYVALRTVRDEFVGGLAAVENYNLAVAEMAGFMTTFSTRAKGGDLAGAFKQSYEYAGVLVEKLEELDAKTVASAEQLNLMAKTFIKMGAQVDLSLDGTEEGIVNVANALVMMAGDQNKNKQIQQEVRGLMQGQLKTQNSLLMMLHAQNPQILKQLEMWKAQGTIIPNLGKELAGMGMATSLLERTWSAIGSTMDTIHKKILRGGMTQTYEDLLGVATRINNALFKNGQLTQRGLAIAESLADTWWRMKKIVKDLAPLFKAIYTILKPMFVIVGVITDGWVQLIALMGPVFKRVNYSVLAIKASVDVLGSAFAGMWEQAKGNPEQAEAFFQLAEAQAQLATRLVKKSFGDGLTDEIYASIAEVRKRLSINPKSGEGAPGLFGGGADSDEKLKKVKEQLTLVQTVAETVAGRMENTFTTLYSNLLDGTADFKESMVGLLKEIMVEMMRVFVIQKAVQGAKNYLFPGSLSAFAAGGGAVSSVSWTAGPTSVAGIWHDGGVVGDSTRSRSVPSGLFNNAPRLHNGLGANEFPAILERGEQVIPKDQAGQQPVNVTIVANDAKSFSDMTKRNPNAIVGPIIEALQAGNQGLRNTLRAAL